MLKFIRRNAEASWVKFMFLAIVIVFVFWGMGGMVGGKKAEFVARVNGEAIEPTDFDRAYENLFRLYKNIYKDNFKPELLKGLDLKGKAVDQLIRVSLLRQEAHKIGLRVGETEMRDAIAALPAFQDNGHFNKELYLRVLRVNNITPGEFEESEREDLLVNKMQALITAGVHVSEAEVHERYDFDNEKVTLRFIKFDVPHFVPDVTVNDEEAKAYYDKRQDLFRQPDRVRVEYVLYPPDKFADKVQISDADVQQYYNAHTDEFSKPEEVHARHILFKAAPDTSDTLKAEVRKKAEEVLAKAKAGEDFAALAKQYSEDAATAPQGGDLGTFTRGKMVKPFEDAAFALEPGQISDIVESPFGFHIIKVESKQAARQETIEEARPQIVEKLKKEKARELAQAQANGDHEKVAGGATLASLAQADGLTVATPPPFGKNDAILGLGRSPLANAAFAAEPGKVGPVVDTPTGFIVFVADEKIAAHVPPMAEIRDLVDSAARNEKAEALAKTKAEAALKELQQNHDIDAVAKSVGLSVEESDPFARQGGYIGKLGTAPQLAKDAFSLTPDKPVAPAVYAASGSSVIAVLKERVPADEEKFKTDKDNLMREAEERRKGEAMQQFVNYLKARANIQVDQDFLASIPDTYQPDGTRRRRR